MARRKILVIMSLKGWLYNGDCLRIKNIFSRLSAGHDVHLLFLDRFNCPGAMEAARPYFKKAFYIDYKPAETFLGRLIKLCKFEPEFIIRDSDRTLYGTIRAKIENIIREEDIDIVHVWGIRNGQFVENVLSAAVLHDLCDSFALTYKNQALEQDFSVKKLITFLRTMYYERSLVKKCFTCFVSARDKKLLGATGNDRCFVVPNGVDAAYFSPVPHEGEERYSFAFSGDMHFRPNIQAACYFYKEIFPIVVKKCPEARWYIIGCEPAEEVSGMHDGKNIIVTGFVERITDYLGKVNVFIAPMVSGLGIKNKILEAMAMGKPVLSTRLGMSGIDYEEGKHVLTADSPGEFTDKLIQLLGDGDLRKRLGENARQLILEKYSWENTVRKYEDLYNKITGERSGKR